MGSRAGIPDAPYLRERLDRLRDAEPSSRRVRAVQAGGRQDELRVDRDGRCLLCGRFGRGWRLRLGRHRVLIGFGQIVGQFILVPTSARCNLALYRRHVTTPR
jgi:hypothetical protein